MPLLPHCDVFIRTNHCAVQEMPADNTERRPLTRQSGLTDGLMNWQLDWPIDLSDRNPFTADTLCPRNNKVQLTWPTEAT